MARARCSWTVPSNLGRPFTICNTICSWSLGMVRLPGLVCEYDNRARTGGRCQPLRPLCDGAGGDPQRAQDLLLVLGMLVREGPEEAEAAGDHHVAVGDGEVGVQAAGAQLAALRAGDCDLKLTRLATKPFDRLRTNGG